MKSGLIAINLAAIIFGTAALFGKLDVSPLWIVAMRGIFAAISLVLFGLARGGLVPLKNTKQYGMVFLTGAILAIHWLTFFLSVQLSGVAIATLTFATFPFFTVLISGVLQRKMPPHLEIIAGIVIVFAVSLLVDLNLNAADQNGIIVGMGSALAFAVFGVISKKLSSELPAMMISLAQNIVVFLVLVPFLATSHPMPSSGTDWLWLVVLGVVTTALMHQLYLYALAKLSASTCSAFIALEPVYAVAFAAIFFGEAITLRVVISGALILGASYLMLLSERKQVASVIP